ncbi:MAG: xanthine dehydrogenase accessory protein XdhC [Pseudorhodobacter sp.]|nr:xanthine dehydrogenase accessory protein XdhC [Pseudorhodobacter sp.]
MFDLGALQAAVAAHGRVARLVVAAVAGSAPREVGAAMLVWPGGSIGTIGGGAFEWAAMARARGMLANGGARLDREALGPGLGQCCGGSVVVLTEVYGAAEVAALAGREVIARHVQAGAVPPLAVRQVLARARGQGVAPAPGLVQGWMIEPVAPPMRALWVWGAGHVGRAVVAVVAPLPGLAITWVDVAPDRFPEAVPDGVTVLPATDPALLVAHVPTDAGHLVLTYSHALDLELCHRLLGHGFGSLGLIGSATKWARFRARLRDLGHSDAMVGRITCPIGNPAFGKHPQAIAIGVAADLLVWAAVRSAGTEQGNAGGSHG